MAHKQTEEQKAQALRSVQSGGFGSLDEAKSFLETNAPTRVNDPAPSNVMTEESLTSKPTPFDVQSTQEITEVPFDPKLEIPDQFALTAPEQEQSDTIKELRGLIGEGGDETQFRREQEQQEGIRAKREELERIRARSSALATEAQAIPLQIQEDFKGRGVTRGGVAPIEAGRLRQNTIQQLGASAAFQAAAGNLALSLDFVDRAVEAEFAPRKQKIENLLQNLELIQLDPATTLADKKRADIAEKKAKKEQKEVEAEEKEREGILNLMTNAAQQGATDLQLRQLQKAETREEALGLMTEFGLFEKEEEAKSLQFISGTANQPAGVFDKNTGVFTPTGGGGPVAPFTPFDTSTKTGQLANISQNLLSKFGSKFQQDAFKSNVRRLSEAGDEQQLADFIFSEAIAQIPDSEARKKAFSGYKISKKLDVLETQLALYAAKGGDTGKFRGTVEDIRAKFGKVGDPDLRSLGIALADTLDSLARDRTGAVISPSEEKFYDRLLPSTKKTAELNQATIDGLKLSLVTDLNSVLRFQLAGAGFDTIEPYLGGDKFELPDVEFSDETNDLEFTDDDDDIGFFKKIGRGFTNFFK